WDWDMQSRSAWYCFFVFFFQAEDGIRDWSVTGVQTCALPICMAEHEGDVLGLAQIGQPVPAKQAFASHDQAVAEGADSLKEGGRSEEHTSELQSLTNLVCRLLLEKKKT